MVATLQVRADFDLSTHVVREEAELWSLASDWKNLFHSAECNNIFLSFEWLSQWWARTEASDSRVDRSWGARLDGAVDTREPFGGSDDDTS